MCKKKAEIQSIDPKIAAKFHTTIEELQIIVRKREYSQYIQQFKTHEELIAKLQTNAVNGLSSTEQVDRQHVFGKNFIQPPPATPFWRLMLNALKDTTMIILIVAAVISLVLTTTIIDPSHLEWIDSVAILIAVFVVVMVTSCNDYSKEKQFRKLNAQKDDKVIKVIRDGSQQEISIHNIVVGDLVILGVGDQIPADGVLISANDVRVDESGMTGESDEIKKSLNKNPFMIGSCLVRAGSGIMVITAVGKNSIYGDILLTLQENDEETPLQAKLNELAKLISYIGIGAAVLTFLALIIRFFVDNKHKDSKNFVQWVNFFILAVSIIVVAVPEGLPLAVTISLAYSMKQMIKDQCLVRKLESCETMGSASNICTDKTGTLTLNQMRVVRTKIGESNFTNDDSNSVGNQIQQQVNPKVQTYINLISAICSTAELKIDDKNQLGVVGNKTEGALLFMSKDMGCDYSELRKGLIVGDQLQGAIAYKIDFSSDRKRMSSVLNLEIFNVQKYKDTGAVVLSKGASEIMLEKCTNMLDQNGEVVPLTQQVKDSYNADILKFAENSLRTLVLAYKKIDLQEEYDENVIETDLTMVCLVGIQDPLRPAVKQAIQDCKKASITVRMVTGDNLVTAIAISKDAGIIQQQITVQEALDQKLAIIGPDFDKLSDQQIDQLLPTLVCMARSAPRDKYRLVCRLKANNYVVAATGDGSNDAPQLKAANVGLAMGIAGTEVAKEASDMIIMNDAFDTIVKAIAWGRTVTANVRKFLQFQLTVNVVALIIAFLGAAILEESALTSIQLLYVNLIMDSLGSLALATEGPSRTILDQPPVHRSASMVTPGMLRNILLGSAFQIIVILCMLFQEVGDKFTLVPENLTWADEYADYVFLQNLISETQYFQLKKDNKHLRQKYRYAVIYNFFIFVQIFNEFNSRRIGQELNIFGGIFKNAMFFCVILITAVVQVIIMLVPGIRDVFNVYNCFPDKLKLCYTDEQTTDQQLKVHIDYLLSNIPKAISEKSWAISICVALCCFFIHLLGRLIKVPGEFGVSQKRIAKDMEKIRKREEKRLKQEEEDHKKKKEQLEKMNLEKLEAMRLNTPVVATQQLM